MKKVLETLGFVLTALMIAASPAKALVYTFEVTVAELKAHLNPELPMNERAIYEVWFKAPIGGEFNNLKTPLKGDDGWDATVFFQDCCAISGTFAKFYDIEQTIGEKAYITDMSFVQGVGVPPWPGDLGTLMADDSVFAFQVKTDDQFIGPVSFDLVTTSFPKCSFQTSPNTCEELFGPFGGKPSTINNSPILLSPRQEVSEPATFAVFALSVFALGFVRTRRMV